LEARLLESGAGESKEGKEGGKEGGREGGREEKIGDRQQMDLTEAIATLCPPRRTKGGREAGREGQALLPHLLRPFALPHALDMRSLVNSPHILFFPSALPPAHSPSLLPPAFRLSISPDQELAHLCYSLFALRHLLSLLRDLPPSLPFLVCRGGRAAGEQVREEPVDDDDFLLSLLNLDLPQRLALSRGLDGGRKGGREREEEGGREGGREREEEGGREGGRERAEEGGREGGREGEQLEIFPCRLLPDWQKPFPRPYSSPSSSSSSLPSLPPSSRSSSPPSFFHLPPFPSPLEEHASLLHLLQQQRKHLRQQKERGSPGEEEKCIVLLIDGGFLFLLDAGR
jgi:hypothetical protein